MATLESLPPEIIFSIYAYLSPLPAPAVPLSTHPFVAISCTSKFLRSHLASYLTHAIITSNVSSLAKLKETLTAPPSAKKSKSASSKRRPTNLLRSYLKSISSICFFCSRKSTRRAIMESSLVCCANCDRKCWPPKITMSEAQKKYRLKREDLFGGVLPPNIGGPPAPPREDGIIPKRPGLKYGQFMLKNVLTTMFFEEDVRMLAWEKHAVANLDEYLAERKERLEEDRRKTEANREKRKAYVRRLAEGNGLNGDLTALRVGMITGWATSGKKYGIDATLGLIRQELLLGKLGVSWTNAAQATQVWWTRLSPEDSPFCRAMTALLGRNNFFSPISSLDSHRKVWGHVSSGMRYRRRQVLRGRRITDCIVEYKFDRDERWFSASLLPCGSDRFEVSVFPSLADGLPSTSSSPSSPVTDVPRIPLWNFAARQITPIQCTISTADLAAMMYRRTARLLPHCSVLDDYEDDQMTLELMEWVDPTDYFLFLEFIQEFGDGEGGVSDELKRPRDVISRRYRMLRELYVEPFWAGSEIDVVAAPWSWDRYPILVQEVVEEEEDGGANAGGQSGGGAAEKVQRRNERRREEYERLCARIREVLREGGWEVLGDPERWEMEVEGVMQGVVGWERNVVKGIGGEKERGKGKGKERAL
ncbi:hypothetical protein BDZ91DRAFT_337221 [Kalaharituber pfeilii]|nr:hypothetical protein BDZ91DRAFT_337221 [Kalaharituber pfeilii]